MFERLKNYVMTQVGSFFATLLTAGFSKAVSSTFDKFSRAVFKGEVLENKAPRPGSILTDFSVHALCNVSVDAIGLLAKIFAIPFPSFFKKGLKAGLLGTLYRAFNNKEIIEPQQIAYDVFSGVIRASFAGESIAIMKQACGQYSETQTSLPMLVVAGVASECMLYYYKKHAIKGSADLIQKEQNCEEALEALRHRHVVNGIKRPATRYGFL